MNYYFKRPQIILCSICFFALLSLAEAMTLRLVYKETHNGQSAIANYSLEKKDNKLILNLKNNEGKATLVSAANYHSYYAIYSFNTDNKQIEIQRTTDTIAISINGSVVKNEKLQAYPWYSNYVLLQDFVLSKKKEGRHYLVVPETQSIMELVQINEGLDNVELKGKTVSAYKVKTTFADWRSAFWASYYWYRAADGVLIKSKETRGPPGTPETAMELVSEEKL